MWSHWRAMTFRLARFGSDLARYFKRCQDAVDVQNSREGSTGLNA